MSDATDDLEYAESGEKARFAKINREIGIVGPKPTENETELKLVKILKELQLDTMAVQSIDKGDYDSDVEYLTAKLHWAEVQIRRLLTSDKQRLLKELMEQAEDHNNGFGKVVPLSVIQNKLEGLS